MRIREALPLLKARLSGRGSTSHLATDEPPLRAELFSAVQMEQHGKRLAASHPLLVGQLPDRLLARLTENERVLTEVCTLLTAAVTAKQRIAPAGEWLLDNFYLIEEQIRTAKRHLPKGYSRELPRLSGGPSSGLPRVYDLALEIIAHGDGRVDPDTLSRFIAAYQSVSVLKLGELWAVPIMLRLALIENLRRAAARIATSATDRHRAGDWADQLTAMVETDPKNLVLTVADMARSNPSLSSAFVAELVRRLRGQSATLALPLSWIEQHLADLGLTIEQSVQAETQQQAANQVSVSNSIGSLRALGAMDWREFVETLSAVEHILRDDPSGVYGRMDFATRDCYRHIVEKLARNSPLAETEVARHAIGLARDQAARSHRSDRAAHVGYYLIVTAGLSQLERLVQARFHPAAALIRAGRQFPLALYLGAIVLMTAVFTGSLLSQARIEGLSSGMLVLLGLLAVVATSHLAVALTNWLATRLVSPLTLPRLDFSSDIPPTARTLVVTPTLISSFQAIDDLLEGLEVRFLANQDHHLYFGLLTDFRDAPQETLPEDAALVAAVAQGIAALNEKYPRARGEDAFFLFHRARRWNPQEGVWMGYERKRGKLGDLNALLRGKAGDRFSRVVGDTTMLENVQYVITLDTDTQLPRDTARELVGVMAHPLNRPHYDESQQRVRQGYGILQPRVTVSLTGMNRSRYARLHSNDAGIDPYTRAVSDVYQDWFQEGSFIGKGIYDVDAFEHALAGRFPENRILSHDLLEGCYARSGLLSDVQFYEDYPVSYRVDVSRRHRWIRGDWQIAHWLLPRVPDLEGRSCKNPLTALSRWKLFDNLRRSVAPAALTLLLVLGWLVLASPVFWTLAVLGILLLPPAIAAFPGLVGKPGDIGWRQHLSTAAWSLLQQLANEVFTLACLPYEAFFSLDAIGRTLWRMASSGRGLLEWTPSTDATHQKRSDLAEFYRTMVSAPTLAALTTAGLALLNPVALVAAGPVLLLWLLAPGIAWWLSRPLQRREARLSDEQRRFLRANARKIWRFFETFVGPQDYWLPPDNYQEQPPAVAHRTSPTNIGLSLLANLSAYDFGYLTAGQLAERTACTLRTMAGLEQYRGHFYNWYDTQSLKPLYPIYISAVDSGNLAGHLLILQSGLRALSDDPIIGVRWVDGLQDTFGMLAEALKQKLPLPLKQFQQALERAASERPGTLVAVHQLLQQLTAAAEQGAGEVEKNADKTAWEWAQALAQQCRSALDELLFLAPWLTLPPPPDSGLTGFLVSGALPTLRQLAQLDAESAALLEQRPGLSPAVASAARKWLIETGPAFQIARRHACERLAAIEQLALHAGEMAQMDYDFLYDPAQHLLAIGYNYSDRRRDVSYYDLLASEVRLGVFTAIAQGQLPQESWFALGRLLSVEAGEPTLISWSGSMFEYLMPLLVMPTDDHTLLDQTYRGVVARQIEYGRQRGVPWGISESGYNAVDAQLNYQYHAFGVPGLGLKRGLASDLVVAPYASALALMVDPEAACANLQHLAAAGFTGPYGFYEAIDYTPSRLPRGQHHAVVRSYMAHHQGMSFLALAYLLLDRPMQKRFAATPQFQATALLLQERLPKTIAFHTRTTGELTDSRLIAGGPEDSVRVFTTPNTPFPEVQLLSNGRYHVMVTNAGGGYSRWKELALTRWREDTTRDHWGTFCYLRDLDSGEFWSTAFQPTLKQPDSYEAIFTEGRAEFRRRDHGIESYTEIAVSPEDDIELRRIRLGNRSRTRRVIEITSYSELVLATSAADALHPAFSNLFAQTEILHPHPAILCTRRPRSREEQPPWLFSLMVVRGETVASVSYETDRMQFIGRGRTVAEPQALLEPEALSGSAGSVLDPIAAIRYRITLDPDQTATVDLVCGACDTRELAWNLIGKYQDQRLADRVFELAWTHAQVVLRQLDATQAEARLYAHLASSVLYANASLRAEAGVISQNRRGQSALWAYGISGDVPIVLLQIGDATHIELVRQLVRAHAYWRLKGLTVDLVIWNEDRVGYRQSLQEQIVGLITAGDEAHMIDRPGGIFVRAAEQISHEDRILFQTVARAILSDGRGTLAEQINQRVLPYKHPPVLHPTRIHQAETPIETPRRELAFRNGLGGFSPDGQEYVITTTPENVTPAPWANVLANRQFGTVVSESGGAYTWSENAHMFRLTPWRNDPVTDASGEAFYLRDQESGHYWSPTPLPRRGVGPYTSRHGFGYSVFEHTEGGIRSELWMYVAIDAPIKFWALKVHNISTEPRRLSATGYIEWVLGDLRPKSIPYVITEIDADSGALFARNPYNSEFADRIAFFDVDDPTRTVSGDRVEFFGRNGRPDQPAALGWARLSGRVGSALDPCAAIQVVVDLDPGEEREIVFRLGVAGRHGAEDARTLVHRYRGVAAAHSALDAVRTYWRHTLGAVRVETPDPSLDVLTNGWLVYQILACRLWARSGYYQSGGAFGFRDQLQDVMALVHTQPTLLREQLLLCAAHQFGEGDVQHWWHPPSNRGVRTRCSDDYLWLPLATARYVLTTGDCEVLDEPVAFLEGRPVPVGEDSYYDLPQQSQETASLYQHCTRAILRGLALLSPRGLPLMGAGDWNDGMNLVGIHGKGESIWLGFFLYDVLLRFSEVAALYGDRPFVEQCREHADRLRQAIQEQGWDGAWYRRAYFDDGTPLGSASNVECQIDSISQSWAVLSGASDGARARLAMDSLDARLVRRDKGLIQLLDPPFDSSELNPGYIKGYVPGVRENGGQYTHSAVWATMAFAALGDHQRAWELLGLINPIHHALTPEAVKTYKVEPYVVAADVYGVAPHIGRGGWSWYTGSAGWLYRLIVESLLGLRLDVDVLHLAPCLPADWSGFKVHYRYRQTGYAITVAQSATGEGGMQVTVDGVAQPEPVIRLLDDGREHAVEVEISERVALD
ncbi:Glycosyltransferase 36 [Candidatus Competibacter denitrificans Run_A_D11]|uniref:Glycosyltransferase 36 n=1 Tax=Candidatus Competibacter denitrificans Run_A_D11 TaxID=1400863 RepID=W6MAG8_9GAMM|nr:glucoamylase family protein [Candidatus Competibacter denitrificans]CDI00748.1 Glycosyltransferase 36 [Candidatus Competibacter denitrificans Run_A_D11]